MSAIAGRSDSIFTIVGASLAGAHAAHALRDSGFEGRIVLIGNELEPPYERPALSKEVLTKDELPSPQWVLAHEQYEATGIHLMTGHQVVALRPEGGRFVLVTASGTELESDKVLLTTGARPRNLNLQGLPCLYLRDWGDAVALRQRLRPGAKVCIIGSGFIGAEIAASAAKLGCEVDLLEAREAMFPSLTSPLIRERLIGFHTAAGVRLRPGAQIEGFRETPGGLVMLMLAGGEEIPADVVVAGIGVQPNTALAEMAGARIGHGIVVNERWETSVPGLFAAGDVATQMDATGGLHRHEHWRSAQDQGRAAAVAMLGLSPPTPRTPWCWSDQLGQRIEIGGQALPTHRQVVRQPDSNSLIVFHLDAGRLVGVVGLNAQRAVRDTMGLVVKGLHPDLGDLADSAIPLNRVRATKANSAGELACPSLIGGSQ